MKTLQITLLVSVLSALALPLSSQDAKTSSVPVSKASVDNASGIICSLIPSKSLIENFEASTLVIPEQCKTHLQYVIEHKENVHSKLFNLLMTSTELKHAALQRESLLAFTRDIPNRRAMVEYACKHLMDKVPRPVFYGPKGLSVLDDYPFAAFLVHEDCYNEIMSKYIKYNTDNIPDAELEVVSHILKAKYNSPSRLRQIIAILKSDFEEFNDKPVSSVFRAILDKMLTFQLDLR